MYSGIDRIDNWAVFGSVGAELTSRLNASFEIRYAEDRIGNYKAQTDTLIQQTFQSWTPRFTVDYKIDDHAMVYLTLVKGNKHGVIHSDPYFPIEVAFGEEESSKNIEVGAKNQFFGGRMTVKVALYYVDWKKQQLTSAYTFEDGTSRSYIVNASVTEVKGAGVPVLR